MFNLFNIFVRKLKPFPMFSGMVKPIMQSALNREHIVCMNNTDQLHWIWRLNLPYALLGECTQADFIPPNRVNDINISRTVSRVSSNPLFLPAIFSHGTVAISTSMAASLGFTLRGRKLIQRFYDTAPVAFSFRSFVFILQILAWILEFLFPISIWTMESIPFSIVPTSAIFAPRHQSASRMRVFSEKLSGFGECDFAFCANALWYTVHVVTPNQYRPCHGC